jgi:hypothetical protein
MADQVRYQCQRVPDGWLCGVCGVGVFPKEARKGMLCRNCGAQVTNVHGYEGYSGAGLVPPVIVVVEVCEHFLKAEVRRVVSAGRTEEGAWLTLCQPAVVGHT